MSEKDARCVVDRGAVSDPVLSRSRSSRALGTVTVNVVPGLRIDETEFVGRDPDYFTIIIVKLRNPVIEIACEERRQMGTKGEGTKSVKGS